MVSTPLQIFRHGLRELRTFKLAVQGEIYFVSSHNTEKTIKDTSLKLSSIF